MILNSMLSEIYILFPAFYIISRSNPVFFMLFSWQKHWMVHNSIPNNDQLSNLTTLLLLDQLHVLNKINNRENDQRVCKHENKTLLHSNWFDGSNFNEVLNKKSSASFFINHPDSSQYTIRPTIHFSVFKISPFACLDRNTFVYGKTNTLETDIAFFFLEFYIFYISSLCVLKVSV